MSSPPASPRIVWLLLLLGISPVARAEHPGSRPAGEPAAGGAKPEETTLDEIVVTGDPGEESANLRTIERKEIERQRTHTAAEVLEREPAIHATTGRRGERIFTFRGFDQRQVVVLLDGAPAYIPYDGQVDLGLLPAEMIDHITIVKGPASVLYGPNGLGGAVNIVTRRPGSAPLLGVKAETGLGSSLLLGGLHSADLGPFSYTLFGGMKRRDSFPLCSDFAPVPRENGVRRENSDSLLYHAGGNFQLRLPRSHTLTAGVAYVDGERGVPPGLMDPVVYYWRFSVWRSVGASLGHSASYLDTKLSLDELVYLRLFDNLLDSYDDATYTTQSSARAFHSWYQDQLFGGRIRGRYRFDSAPWGRTFLRLWAGVQHDRHEEEPSLDEPITRSLVTLAPEVEAFIGERWSVLGGLQLDVEVPGSASSGSQSSRVGLGPLLSARFDPLLDLSLRATAARRTRFPTLRERYSAALRSRLPNPDLGPESAWHFGLEASWQARYWLLVQGSVHDAEVADLIDLVSIGGGQQQQQNIPGARLFGVELSVKVTPWRWLGLRGGYNYLFARRTEELAGSDLLQYRPEHKGSVELILAPRPFVEWSTLLRVVSPRPYQHPASGSWEALDTSVNLEMRLSVMPTRWSVVWLRAANLLDSSEEAELGYPEPGREIWVGLRVSYDRDLTPRRPGRRP